ncbi:MAG: hypothetical protein KGJ60_02155 [Verrucomicrobiota bacterium]|nr:hypothetical protein [Verrucomicrobiota bacterium]
MNGLVGSSSNQFAFPKLGWGRLTSIARIGCLLWSALWLGWTTAEAQSQRVVAGHAPEAVAHLKSVGVLPATHRLRLVLGLPLRHQPALNDLIGQLYDPGSASYHRWLKPEQFTQRFGPTRDDYEKVIAFARANGLEVTGLCSNRMLVDVEAPVSNIEKAFRVTLRLYPHPTEKRNFYAPDTDPTVDTNVPILQVSGLDNYIVPHPLLKLGNNASPADSNQPVTPFATGSGPGGDFTGKDFRAAYAPGVTNTGAGQYIAIVDVGGPYYAKDIYMYETNAGFSTNIVVTNILLSGWTGVPTGSSQDDGEETLDIDMALSVAPGATILNYEGEAHDVFNRIATDDLAKQITLSYGFGIDASIQQMFMEFVAQGQAFFQASGDGGADLPGGTGLTGEPYATIVGGTSLTTSGAGGPWQSETTWIGSGGGSSGYGIPAWQQGVNMAANQGSTLVRNYPDVAMLADTVIWWYFKNGQGGTVGGTSASSPQWAGFMSLVNQSAAARGLPSVGFLNPAVYAIGKGNYSAYANAFHDIATGNNFNSQNPTRYAAAYGYDLCTGWGSPRGNSTIAALVGFGTNDFTLNASQVGLTVVPGGVAVAVLQVAPMKGFKGNVSLAMSALPAGVAASLNPSSVTTNPSILTLTTSSSTPAETSNLTLTAASGALTHTLTINLAVLPPYPGAAQVSLSSYFNRAGIYTDGSVFGGGLDGGGSAYSANLLGPRPSLGNMLFALGPANSGDAIACSGQTLALPAGHYTTLQMLATGINGNQNNQTFNVSYTDNSKTTFAQGVSDWFTPQHYAGESILAAMPYRDNSNGTKDNRTFYLYDHSFTLDQTKTVRSITLPNNGNVIVMAITLANAPAAASLASFYNRAGIYTDGTTFTNPPSGGMDGGGYAYSANLLTGSQTWSNTLFNFGPANATNVVSAAGQTLPLPAGNYSILRMLATGVQGNQMSQTFNVNYMDGTAQSFVQSLSDWYSPQNYAGESKALVMGHRNVSDGTADKRTFYLYGYSFKLNSGKTVQSLRLPNDPDVIVAAVSLVPNWPPTFNLNPFAEPDVVAGQNYSANISTNAGDLDGDALAFAKVSGPAWLNVSDSGALSGTPLSAQVGTNTFLVSVTDSGGLSNTATLNITVLPAPPILLGIINATTNLVLNWSGGIAPFQAQMSTNLASPNWVNVGSPISSNTLVIAPSNAAAFYRILGQ